MPSRLLYVKGMRIAPQSLIRV